MAEFQQGAAWIRPTDAELERIISRGRKHQREATKALFHGLFSVAKEKFNVLRRELARFTQVSSAS